MSEGPRAICALSFRDEALRNQLCAVVSVKYKGPRGTNKAVSLESVTGFGNFLTVLQRETADGIWSSRVKMPFGNGHRAEFTVIEMRL